MKFLDLLRQRSRRTDIYSESDFWNGKAREFEGTAVSMFPNQNLNALMQRDQFTFIDEVLTELHGRSVLDLGSGTGRLSRHLARRGATVSAVDFAAEAVAIADAQNQGLPITTRVMSVFDLDDEALHDDAAVLGCLTVACRSEADLVDAVRRLHRSLRPDARVALLEPFHDGFLHRVLKMPRERVIEVLRDGGFRVDRQARMHFWPVRFFLAPVSWPAPISRAAYAVGETVMRLPGPLGSMGDYLGLGLRRV